MLQDNSIGGSGVVSSKFIYKNNELLNFNLPFSSDSSIELVELVELRKNLLEEYKKKQTFRVSIGKSEWVNLNQNIT